MASPWRIELTGYGWASSIAGSSGFGGLPTLPYYASFGKVLEHLDGALMGSVLARNDTYILGLDMFWSRIGGAGTINVSRLPANALGADLTLTEGFATAFGGLRIPIGPPNLELYGTVGARYMYSGTKVALTTPLGFGNSQSVNKDWVNPVAGFAAQYRFDDRWFMNVLGDLGGWSDSATGQALASVGYNWTQNWSTTLGYRVLYTYERQDTGFNNLTGDRQQLPLPAMDVWSFRGREIQLLRFSPACAGEYRRVLIFRSRANAGGRGQPRPPGAMSGRPDQRLTRSPAGNSSGGPRERHNRGASRPRRAGRRSRRGRRRERTRPRWRPRRIR